jgi:HlyD family secretion protein
MGVYYMLGKIIKYSIKKIAGLLIIMILALQISGCYFFPQEEEILSPPLREPQSIEYRTVEVTRGDIEKRINGTGYFVSDLQTDLYFTYRGGRIKSINFKNGDMVNAGDVVIELESENLENQILQQNMNLQKLKLNLEQNLKNIERSIVLANMQLEDLQKEYERVREITDNLDEGITLDEVMPGTDLEELENSIERQEFIIEGEQLKYSNAKDTAELDIQAIEFQLANLHAELEKTKLVSPVTGRIVLLT